MKIFTGSKNYLLPNRVYFFLLYKSQTNVPQKIQWKTKNKNFGIVVLSLRVVAPFYYITWMVKCLHVKNVFNRWNRGNPFLAFVCLFQTLSRTVFISSFKLSPCKCNCIYIILYNLYIRKNCQGWYFKARLCGQLKPEDLQLCLCIELGGRKLVRSHILIRFVS